MAPTPSPVLVHPSNPPFGRHLHHFRRQTLLFFHNTPGQSSASRTERSKPRVLDATLQPSEVLEGPPSPPIAPTPSESAVLAPEPSATPVRDNQPQGPNLLGDIPGNIVAAVVVVVLILGGLIGLVVGGEMLRRRTRTTRKRVSPPPSRYFGHRKYKPTKNVTESPQRSIKTSHENVPRDEKTSSLLTRPPPALNRERLRRLSDVWPIRSLSRALCNRQSHSVQVGRNVERPPSMASPQTTWSDFSPVSLYVAPPRTVLSRIPEELEDCESQTDIAAILGVTLQRSPEPDSLVSTPRMKQPKLSRSTPLEGFNRSGSSVTTEQRGSQDCRTIHEGRAGDEDAKSLGSSAPEMTLDGGESSRSSMTSLKSLEGGNDRESLREEAFELRRAQTTSMQINKGVLLSLSLKTLDDNQNLGLTHGELECGPSRSPSADAEDGKDYIEREMSLAMLGGSFSAVSLDEFPSPPSVLPMIPSLVSGF